MSQDAHSQGRENLGRPRPRLTNKSDGMEVDPSWKNEQGCGGLSFHRSLGMQAARRGIIALKKCFSWGICPRRSQGGRVDKASQGFENMWVTRRSWSFLGLSGGRWVVEKRIMVEADINTLEGVARRGRTRTQRWGGVSSVIGLRGGHH